jgi:transposase
MARIGKDVSECLDVIPAQLRVLMTRRLKFALSPNGQKLG